jgi:PAS domain S-box-containing protein
MLAFFPLYERLGVGVAALAGVPTLAAGWLLGSRAGLIAGLIFFPINTLLLNLVGHAPAGWGVVIQGGGGPGSLILIFIGAMTGLLREELQARKQAQLELSESEQKFRLISEQSLLAIAILQDDQIKYANQALAQISGYSVDEMRGMGAIEFAAHIHPEDLAFVVEQAQRKQRGDPDVLANYAYRFFTKSGEVKWIDQFSKTIQFEGRPASLVTLLDISERKKAEQTLHLRSAALESAANAIVITDKEGTIIWGNPAFTRLTGYGESEFIGRNPRFLKSGCHDRAFYEALWDTILDGDVWHGEMVNRHKDGRQYTEEHTITPVCDDQGQITHFISIRRDVTEERAVQQQLQQQERLAAVGQLAAGIAHDFNNTMAVIVLYSDLLRQAANLNPRNRERLSTIYQQALHATRLTQQIVDFSRRSLMERIALNMKPFLKEMMKLWERTLPENIALHLSYDERDYIVNADPTRLQQVLMNLVVNARDAMPDGGRLCLALSHLALSPGQRPPFVGMEAGSWMCLDVANSGAGIPPDVLPYVFEPFFTTKSPDKGAGLGLAQVYGIVKQHDGYITAKSSKGNDTTFTVYLPLISASEPAPASPEMSPMKDGGTEQILLVEDDRATREAMRDTLEAAGYQVLVAADGQIALEVLARPDSAVDLVLSDLVMPDMGGVELYQALQLEQSHLKMIVMTGYPLKDDGRALLEQGIVDWVAKPIAASDLVAKVRATLDLPA